MSDNPSSYPPDPEEDAEASAFGASYPTDPELSGEDDAATDEGTFSRKWQEAEPAEFAEFAESDAEGVERAQEAETPAPDETASFVEEGDSEAGAAVPENASETPKKSRKNRKRPATPAEETLAPATQEPELTEPSGEADDEPAPIAAGEDPELPETPESETDERTFAPDPELKSEGDSEENSAEESLEKTSSTPTDEVQPAGEGSRAEGAMNPEEAPAADTAEEAEVGEEADEESTDAVVFTPDPDKLLLALLFASQEFLSAKALREAMGDEWDTPRLRQLVKAVNKQLTAQAQPFEVVETDATFRLRTRTEYFPWVRRLFKGQAPRKLSQAGLETLAIIAYKQPITKAEIEAIRGVNIDGALKSLLEKRFIDISRRADAVGGAFTYCTTREFMRYFGLNRLPEDLPRLSEFEQIVNAKALIPQIAADGSVVEGEQAEPDAEQMEFHGEIHP